MIAVHTTEAESWTCLTAALLASLPLLKGKLPSASQDYERRSFIPTGKPGRWAWRVCHCRLP